MVFFELSRKFIIVLIQMKLFYTSFELKNLILILSGVCLIEIFELPRNSRAPFKATN